MTLFTEFANQKNFIIDTVFYWILSSIATLFSLIGILLRLRDNNKDRKYMNDIRRIKTPRLLLYLYLILAITISTFLLCFASVIITITEKLIEKDLYNHGAAASLFVFALALQIIPSLPCLINSYFIHGYYFLSHSFTLFILFCLFNEQISNLKFSSSEASIKANAIIITFAMILSGIKFLLYLCIPCHFSGDSKQLIWPERKVNLCSRLNFLWLFRPMISAWHSGVSLSNTLKLDEYNLPQHLSRHILQQWRKERYNGKSYKCLIKYILSIYKKQFTLLVLLRALTVLSSFIFPYLTEIFVKYYDDSNFDKLSWKYSMLIVSLIISMIMDSCLSSQFFYYAYFVSKELLSGITDLIYQKIIRIKTTNRNQEQTIEKILNFISNEFPMVLTFVIYFPMLIVLPFELVGFIYILYSYVKYSIFIGLGCIIVIFMFTSVTIKQSKKLLSKQVLEQDKRIKAVTNLLNGIKIIKLYAWEDHFESLINQFRKKEVRYFKLESIFNVIMTNLWNFSSTSLTVVTFVSYIFIVRRKYSPVNRLEPAKAISILYLLNLIRMPISLLPMIISSLIITTNAFKRLHDYLSLHEKGDNKWLLKRKVPPKNANKTQKNNEEHIKHYPLEIKASKYTYNLQSDFCLTLKDMKIESGSLIGIAGTVGSGKTSFFAAICGNMINCTSDESSSEVLITIDDSIAYSSQEPWLQSRSIKQNILFFNDYNKKHYDRVVGSCSLFDDFSKLPAGDMTLVGERGINISGGQKQRIALARAAYANKDIYLLDDPQSALDVHVGKHIFEKVISNTGILKRKTRLLVSNDPEILKECDKVMVFVGGHVQDFDSYSKISKKHDFLHKYTPKSNKDISNLENLVLEDLKSKARLSKLTMHDSYMDDLPIIGNIEPEVQLESFFTGEKVETDSTKLWDILNYFKRYTPYVLTVCIISFVVSLTMNVLGDYFLYLYMYKSNELASINSPDTNLIKYFWYFVLFSVSFIIISAIFYSSMVIGGHKSSSQLHNEFFTNMLHWPIESFERISSGKIISRLSKDLHTIDFHIPRNLQYLMLTFVGIAVSYLQVMILDQIMIIFIVISLFIICIAQRIYIGSSRKYRCFELVSRHPVLGLLIETYRGNHIISAMGTEKFMLKRFQDSLSEQIRWTNLQILSHRWISIIVDLTIGCLMFSYLMVTTIRKTKPSKGVLVGYAMANIKRINIVTFWFIRSLGDFETNAISIPRLTEFLKLPLEPEWHTLGPIKDHKGNVIESWPIRGEIKFDNMSFTYRENLPPALNQINLTIKSGSKVGVVGRTGAGKSTLISALFRTRDPSEGHILIDGVDISKIGLHLLRSNLTLIPQDPVIFETSLRGNLDPESKLNDDDLMKYLKMAELDKVLCNTNENQTTKDILDMQIHDDMFSLGQKQLVCLVRALLRQSKILLLDEATASVDQQTDAMIQNTIKRHFKNTTIVTIAHRLQTIIDSDKIVVMGSGKVLEYGSPQKLVDKHGEFYSMCKAANLLSRFKSATSK